MTSIRLALAFGLALFASLASAEPVFPPGSRIGLVPPPGLTASKAFQGFEDRARGAVLVITELSAQSYAKVEQDFGDERMRAGGMELIARETIETASGPALLVGARQTENGIAMRKWALLALVPNDMTAVIVATFPESAKEAYPDAALRACLTSLLIRTKLSTDELLAVLPYRLGDLAISALDLQMAVVATLCLAVAFGTLYFTSIGRQMRAVADNPDLARVSGIHPERVMIALWALVGAITAVAGLILGVKTVVSPEIGWEMLLPAFAAAILGGLGSPVGAVLAGLLLGAAQEISTPFVGFSYKIALSFVVILFVLLVRPTGLLGRVEGVR